MANRTETSVELICATNLEPEPISWLWTDWLAAGKFHILAGAPGTGKTTIALSLAATVSNGGDWPDGTLCEPGNVIIWSGEDDPKDTLLPRLLAHGADRNRIYFISNVFEDNKPRSFDPARDIPKLYDKAVQIGDVRMIIIDPVVNAISGDSHKNGEVRRDLRPLIDLGDKLKAAIIGITHFNKGTLVRDPLERVTGSIAFGALARVVLATAKITDINGQEKRLFVRAKSNNGPDGDGFQYQIEQIELEDYLGVFSSLVIWGDEVKGSAQELLTDINNQTGTINDPSILDEAKDFLKILLSEGPVSKREVDEKARAAGIKGITLRRAKTLLGIETVHDGYGKGSTWKWSLPSKVIKNDKDAHTYNHEHHWENMSTFDDPYSKSNPKFFTT
jgi:putative DNA primase/helicase